MTEQQPEPTLADVLAALNALREEVAANTDLSQEAVLGVNALGRQIQVGLTGLTAHVDQVGAQVAEVGGKVGQLQADVAQIKAEHALYEGFQTDLQKAARTQTTALRRHEQDPGAHGGRAAA